MRAADETFLVFAGMRNEGPFIVEWVSWYRMLGFEILVATNDCTDRSAELLDTLAGHGWLTHVTHAPPPGTHPKLSAYAAGRAHPRTAAADWVLVCDVDEFLVLHAADTIRDFIGDGERDFLGMAFSWRCFGTAGRSVYEDGLVHRQFRRCGPPGMTPNGQFKSMFRRPRGFAAWSDHTPLRLRGTWGAGGNIWVNSAGQHLRRFDDRANHPIRHLYPAERTHVAAQMNHYILRSRESFELKRGTPSASAGKDRYTDRFLKAHDRNGFKDTTALRFAARFDPVHAAAMALPGVARLHHLCCADYVARLCAHQGRDPAEDPRWTRHMAAAEAAAG